MNRHEISLNHPHDHFNRQHLSVKPNSCFVLMPFEERFTIVYETIVKALKGLMNCSRADDLPLGNPILERILTGISSAELIIADLTGKNPNVFYELGLAHTRTKDVLLLTQDIHEIPFDLRGLFCHSYSPHSTDGLEHLEEIVKNAAKKVRAKNIPKTLESTISRTEQIVDYMRRLKASPGSQSQMIIRIQAGFSSISNEGYPDSGDATRRRYGRLLEEERDCLINLIDEGTRLRAVLHPPIGPWTTQEGGRVRRRFDRLLEFLKTRRDLKERCEFALASDKGSNLFFFGEDALFEGHKTGVEAGYGWTAIYTDESYLESRLKIFDNLFQSAQKHTLRVYGPKHLENRDSITVEDKDVLWDAVVEAIKMARDGTTPRAWW